MKIKKSVFFILICSVVLFCSCSKSLGYSVLLWDIPENKLQDGQLLKVYYKSNITQKYIVGLPKGKERYEVPFWKIILLVAISMISVPILTRVFENLIL